MLPKNHVENGKDVVAQQKSKKIIIAILPFLSILILVIGWFIASGMNSKVVASPLEVTQRIIKLFQVPISNISLFGHIGISLLRVFVALFFATVIGVPMGIMIGWSPIFGKTIGTLFELIRPIPALAWIPLVIVWFGLGETSKVVMVFIGALMPLVVNSYTAIKLVPSLYVDVGRMFNAVTNYQILKNIILPASLPTIFAGFRNSTSVGWMVVLAAEMLAAKSGLGFLITRGMESFDVALIMVGMIFIGLVGALLAVLTNYLERKLCPWNRCLMSE